MLKLSKTEVDLKADLVSRLAMASKDIEAKITEINGLVTSLTTQIMAYNEIVKEANSFCADIVLQMEDYVTEKGGGKWIEGESEEAILYSAWKTEWEEVMIIAMDDPNHYEINDDMEQAAALDELPASPE